MFFRYLRDGRGYSLLAVGLAMLALGGILAYYTSISPYFWTLAQGCWVSGILVIALYIKRARESRYDLKRLWDDTPAEDELIPRYDTVSDPDAVPYCGWCDEAHPPGTARCPHCCRPLS